MSKRYPNKSMEQQTQHGPVLKTDKIKTDKNTLAGGAKGCRVRAPLSQDARLNKRLPPNTTRPSALTAQGSYKHNMESLTKYVKEVSYL